MPLQCDYNLVFAIRQKKTLEIFIVSNLWQNLGVGIGCACE